MEFILFVIIVVFWRVWLYPILYLVNFLPNSFFVSDSTAKPTSTTRRRQYSDSTPDPFIDVKPSTEWVANQFMSPESKVEYLKSTRWHSLRQAVLTRDEFKCKCCNSTDSLEIHHIVYTRLGNEHTSDLATLCNHCHSRLHKILGYDRGTTFDFSILKNEY